MRGSFRVRASAGLSAVVLLAGFITGSLAAQALSGSRAAKNSVFWPS